MIGRPWQNGPNGSQAGDDRSIETVPKDPAVDEGDPSRVAADRFFARF
jgi:hypothetical protein